MLWCSGPALLFYVHFWNYSFSYLAEWYQPPIRYSLGWTFAANCACIHQSGGGAFDPEFGRTTCSGKMEADRRDVLCPFYLPTPATNCLRFPFRFLRSETRARKEECVRNAMLTSSGDVAPRARARACVCGLHGRRPARARACAPANWATTSIFRPVLSSDKRWAKSNRNSM